MYQATFSSLTTLSLRIIIKIIMGIIADYAVMLNFLFMETKKDLLPVNPKQKVLLLSVLQLYRVTPLNKNRCSPPIKHTPAVTKNAMK